MMKIRKRIATVVGVALLATFLQSIALASSPASADPLAASKLNQTSSIWENDDGVGVDNNSLQAAGNAAITNVKRGERITLRTQLTNSGGATDPSRNVSLFYDRNDGLWSRVGSGISPNTSTGNCTNTAFSCSTIASSGYVGEHSDSAVDPSGAIWSSYFDATGQNLVVSIWAEPVELVVR